MSKYLEGSIALSNEEMDNLFVTTEEEASASSNFVPTTGHEILLSESWVRNGEFLPKEQLIAAQFSPVLQPEEKQQFKAAVKQLKAAEIVRSGKAGRKAAKAAKAAESAAKLKSLRALQNLARRRASKAAEKAANLLTTIGKKNESSWVVINRLWAELNLEVKMASKFKPFTGLKLVS